MARKSIEGIIAVMLTPFTSGGAIDHASLERLIDWYVAHQVDVLFAVCQSSEVFFLSLQERADLARFVVEKTAGRRPVVASGHVSDDRAGQLEELQAVAESGCDALILITNRLDPKNEGEAAFRANLDWLLARLPASLPLGLYECPAPYRRLLSDSELSYCAGSGRFVVMKDVCCDLARVAHRARLVAGTPLAIVNANGTIALEAMRAGSKGYSGVFTNIHPDLYAWMYRHRDTHPEMAAELSEFLVLCSVAELMGYPAMAKVALRKMGVFETIACRSLDYDYDKQFWWGGAPIVDKLLAASERMRRRLAAIEAGDTNRSGTDKK